MRIESIAVSNFKSFSKSEIELGQFNVLVGANASGKSNFVQIFKFLRDTVEYDFCITAAKEILLEKFGFCDEEL